MSNLKSCPFCGAEPKLYYCNTNGQYITQDASVSKLYGRDITHKMIICSKCGIRTKTYATNKEAFNAWNRRP